MPSPVANLSSSSSSSPSVSSNRARAGLDDKRRKPPKPTTPSSNSLKADRDKDARRKAADTQQHASSSRPIRPDNLKRPVAAQLRTDQHRIIVPMLPSSDRRSHVVPRDTSYCSSSSSSPEPLLNILGVPDGDPFDISPLPSERRSRELLSLYVGTEAFTTASVQGNQLGQRFETDMRRERWFPLALRSRAGYAGLIAYLESDRSNPLQRQTEVYRRQYLSVGLQELAKLLRDPDKILEDETVFAVLMFMVVALQLRDFEAVRTHSQGLYRLICQRAKAAGDTPPLVQVRTLPGYEDTGIPELVRHGHIRQEMADILRCNLILSQFTSAFSKDYVAGFGTGHHVWKTADMPANMTSIENGIMNTYRVYIRRVATKNPLIVSPLVLTTALQRNLEESDLERIWSTTPYLLMWAALTAGPASEGATFDFFVRLLKETQVRTFTWSFQSATQITAQLFFWSPALNATTEQWWDRIISTSEMPGPYRAAMTPERTTQKEDSLERSLTLQGDVALRGPRSSPAGSAT